MTDTAAPATKTWVRGAAPPAWLALTLASLAFFLITLDILIVNVALTSIGRELGGGTAGQSWVVDGYTLMFAALLLCAGNLSDRLGAKRCLGIGTALFLASSAACAAAPTLGLLVAARFAQGAAAATMLPASMALISEAYPDTRRRAKALGIWAMGGSVAAAVGPLLGGVLTTVDWRLVFAINIPVCIAMVVLLRFVAASARRPVPFDWAGQVLAITALTALTYGLIHGGSVGFGEPSVIAALALGVVGIGAFVAVEARIRHPMMPLALFDSAGMRIAVCVGFTFMVGWFGTVFLVSLFLQQHLGLSPLHAGLAFVPSAVISLLGNVMSGRLRNRYGPRVPAVAGQLSMVLGLSLLVVTAPLGSTVLTAILIVPVGAGGGIAMPQVTGLVLDSVPTELAGAASAAFNTFRQVGGAVAIAVFGALLSHSAGFVGGMQLSLTIAACLVFSAALVSLRIKAPRRLS